MMKVDIAMSGNNDEKSSWNEGILDGRASAARGIVGTAADTGTDTESPRCLLLEFLPRDLLTQSILTCFLDGGSLANFWCATMSKREMVIRRSSPRSSCSLSPLPSPLPSPSSMVEEIRQIIQRRKTMLTEGEDVLENTGESQHYCLRRQVFQAFEEAVVSAQLASDATTDIGTASRDKKNPNESGNSASNESSFNELQTTSSDPFFNFGGFLGFSRKIFGNLAAIDYCETVPHNLVWCGYLKVQHSRLGGTNATESIQVALVVHPRRWSLKEIRLWRNATTMSPLSTSAADAPSTVEQGQAKKPATMKATIIPHNFLAVGPTRGRLVGLRESDRKCLSELVDGLNRSEQVARFCCTTASGTTAVPTDQEKGGQFTVKLLSFAQAERKLSTVFRRGYEPGGIPLSQEKEGMVLHSVDIDNNDNNTSITNRIDANNDRNSLLCCWNHEFLWEDSRSFRMETSYALRDTMKEYDRLVKQRQQQRL